MAGYLCVPFDALNLSRHFLSCRDDFLSSWIELHVCIPQGNTIVILPVESPELPSLKDTATNPAPSSHKINIVL